MTVSRSEAGWAALGTIIVTVGAGLAGTFAFEGRVGLVTLGFLLFVVGYRVSQAGIHRDQGDSLLDPDGLGEAIRRQRRPGVRAAFLVAGTVGIGYGVTTFSQTIIDPGFGKALLAGVTSIGGYMSAHVGINGNLV